MMKKLVCFALLLMTSFPLTAQLRFGVKAGIGGGFTTGGQEVFTNLFVNYSGGNVGGKLKIAPPLSPINIVGFVHYAFTSGSATSGSTTVSFNDRLNVLNAGVGLEFEIIQAKLAAPYLAADFGTYSFSGNNNSFTRAGVGVGGGIEIAPPALPISFDIEAKYRFGNLLGRESRTFGTVTISENALNYFQISALLTFQLL